MALDPLLSRAVCKGAAVVASLVTASCGGMTHDTHSAPNDASIHEGFDGGATVDAPATSAIDAIDATAAPLAGGDTGSLSDSTSRGTGSYSGRTDTSVEAGDSSSDATESASDPVDQLTPAFDSAVDGGPPSCEPGGPGMTDCGPSKESCCTTLDVPGGTFDRSYDYDRDALITSAPATVSDLRLDKYEITVGRFRKFVGAVIAGWQPSPQSGKHTHLNGGQGLSNSAATGGYETGWDLSWPLPKTAVDWTRMLQCSGAFQTWTAVPADNEDRPINCTTWFATDAFCIWDGGFLPSEAEWGLAAAGGAEQRINPWSSPPSSTTIDCSYANFSYTCTNATLNVGSDSPKGDGRWGHTDLVGNVAEWTLDWFASYQVPCIDCAWLTAPGPPQAAYHVARGGAFDGVGQGRSGNCVNDDSAACYEEGARCGRSP